MNERPIKRCACGRSFTRREWDQLAHLPNWPNDFGMIAEVRNCTCGSTLLYDVSLHDAGAQGERARVVQVKDEVRHTNG